MLTPYLLISIINLLISIIHLLISIIHLLISIIHLLISINHLFISIKMDAGAIFTDTNTFRKVLHPFFPMVCFFTYREHLQILSNFIQPINTCPLQRQVNVNGQRIKWKDKVKYLGNILTKDMCDDADIRAKRGEFLVL